MDSHPQAHQKTTIPSIPPKSENQKQEKPVDNSKTKNPSNNCKLPLRIRRKLNLEKLYIPPSDFKPINQQALQKAKQRIKERRKKFNGKRKAEVAGFETGELNHKKSLIC